MVTETGYDALDRVRFLTQKGASPAEDLITEHRYDIFGELFQTILPTGNVIEYSYDQAGRLVAIERKPDTDPASHGERIIYQLDGFGHRIHEALERWDGASWVVDGATSYEYSTRCHLDRVISGAGSAAESVTEYKYDCNGNLERQWDANHPADGGANPPSMIYAYDVLDRLTSVTTPWGGGGGGNVVTSYGYDVQDHLVSVTDGEGNVTEYDYSDRDLMTEERSPVSGVTTHSYDEHASLVSTLDARSITVTQTYDAADRLTLVDLPDPTLDITYTYDDPAVPFSKGRLTSIARNGASVDYTYDRFGRMTQDGELTYGYDANGNRTTIGYPGGVTATYGFDFADREASLEVDDGTSLESVVTSASYLASGPLTALTLGNGTTESRLFDLRYFPTAIEVMTSRLHAWDYLTDAVGNITSIVETEGCESMLTLANQMLVGNATFRACDEIIASPNVTIGPGAAVVFQAGQRISLGDGFSVALGATFRGVIAPPPPAVSARTFSYQDFQYFLTSADGSPWGSLAWTYDRIGNRLSEDRNGSLETYSYLSNGSGNTAILTQAGSRTYTTGQAGHVTGIDVADDPIALSIDDAGRVAGFERPLAAAETDLFYDGRSFLQRAEEVSTGGFTTPAYDSSGLLHALHHQLSPASPEERTSVFYFAGRPVAQLRQELGGGSSWLFLATDHLGTPVLATDLAGEEIWHGPFEPFGEDFYRGSSQGALASGVFLRFPGQWDDEIWGASTLGAEAYYNVHRWYVGNTGRYTSPDPLGLVEGDPPPYSYVMNSPVNFMDPFGLRRLGVGGRFCIDDNCVCVSGGTAPPLQVLSEDSPTFVSALPSPGDCVDADAVYGPKGTVKIRDFGKCTLRCDKDGNPEDVGCGIPPPIFFDCDADLPTGWPLNTFCR